MKRLSALWIGLLVCVCSGIVRSEEPPPDEPEKAAPPPAASVVQDPAALLARARETAAARPVEALALYRQALLAAPAQIGTREEYAALATRQNRADVAIEQYRILWQDDPSPARALTLVRTLMQARLTTDAAIVAEDAVKQYPEDLALAAAAGEALVAIGQYARAVPYLERVAAAPAAAPAAVLALAVAAEKCGNLFLAAQACLRLLEGPEAAAARSVLSRLRQQATMAGELAFFPPDGWRADVNGWVNGAGDRLLTITTPPTGAADAAARSLVCAGLPEPAVAALATPVPENVAKALDAHVAKEHGGANAAEIEHKSADLVPRPLMLTVAPGPTPPGGMIARLDATAEAIFVPGAPVTRFVWVGTARERPVAVTLFAPAGADPAEFVGLCTVLVDSSLLLPEVD